MNAPTAFHPAFSIEGYVAVLERIRALGYSLVPVTSMRSRTGPSAHVRHDIDLHVEGIERIAREEAALGVRATYYVLLTGHYNALSEPAVATLRELVGFGHELGLHYDLQLYPDDPVAAKQRLQLEVSLLGMAVGCTIETIVRHQPSLGGGDPFLQGSGFLNAHDPEYAVGMRYFSDSCRLWRESEFNQVLSGQERPDHLQLNTHPESWLNGAISDPSDYVRTQVFPTAIRQQERFFRETVSRLWEERHAARARDAASNRSDS